MCFFFRRVRQPDRDENRTNGRATRGSEHRIPSDPVRGSVLANSHHHNDYDYGFHARRTTGRVVCFARAADHCTAGGATGAPAASARTRAATTANFEPVQSASSADATAPQHARLARSVHFSHCTHLEHPCRAGW